MACEDMGFGAYAHDIFMQLDSDHSGLVSYSELLNELDSRTGTGFIPNHTKKFLTALACHNASALPPEEAARLDTSSWVLRARDVRSLRKELGVYLLKNKLRISDLYRIIMEHKKGSSKIRKDEFHGVMRHLGYGRADLASRSRLSSCCAVSSPTRSSRASSSSPDAERMAIGAEQEGTVLETQQNVLDDVFDYIDADSSGEIDIAELYSWIDGTTAKRHIAAGMTLLAHARNGRASPSSGEEQSDRARTTLKDIDWSVEELRNRIQLMLVHHDSSPLYLLKRFDDSDGQFTFKEWLRMMKKLVNPSPDEIDLWDCEIRPVVHNAFLEVSGGDGSLDVVELERWLNKGWSAQVAKVARQREVEALELLKHHRARQISVEDAMDAKAKGMAWMAAAKRAQEERLREATQLATASTKPLRPPPRPTKKAQVPKAKMKMARAPPQLPSSAGAELRDRESGWEVRSYLAKVCTLAQEATTRHPHDQWQLLEDARLELLENQRPRGRPTVTHEGVAYEFR